MRKLIAILLMFYGCAASAQTNPPTPANKIDLGVGANQYATSLGGLYVNGKMYFPLYRPAGADTFLLAVVDTTGRMAPVSLSAIRSTIAAARSFAVQRANHTGTQPLQTLSQSGALAGQVVQWNGSAWAPATVSAGGGSSLSGLTTGKVPVASSDTTISNSNITFAGGNVGIGNASPASALDVTGYVNSSLGFTINQSTSGAIFNQPNASIAHDGTYGLVLKGSVTSPTVTITNPATQVVAQFNTASNNFQTGITQVSMLKVTGSVGIGTTTPQADLDVNGTIRAALFTEATDDADAATKSVGVGQFYSTGGYLRQRRN